MVLLALVNSALAETPAVPEVPACTVMVPILTVDAIPKDVGMMFATQVGERRVFVTAHSLFGPAGGFAAPIPASELSVRVAKVAARDAFETKTQCGFSPGVLAVPDAVPMGGGNDGSKDVAVFAVGTPATKKEQKAAAENPPLHLLSFAATAPAVGDVVYVLAPHAGKTERVTPGKVVEAGAGTVYFQYDDPAVDVTGTVGAPVVNVAGEVVGLNLGAGKMEDGALIGAASPLGPLRERVEKAAGK